MADTIIHANCGFFDAVDGDRTYSADDFNEAFKGLFRNGIYLNTDGSVNDYFRCSVADLVVSVNPGKGMFGDHWFELSNTATFTVPVNQSGNSRIDSVLIQVDTRLAQRYGNVVYRPGTASANPVQPSINSDPEVIEYRIANITVAPQAVSVSVTDLRSDLYTSPVLYDTGWNDLTLTNGTAYNTSRKPQVRRIGNVVYIRGSVKGFTGAGAICTLNSEYRPSQAHIYTVSQIQNAATYMNTIVINVGTNGTMAILASASSMSSGSSYEIPLNTSFAI